MNDRRMNAVKLAFDAADSNCNGELTLAEIQARYDVTFNQDFQEGRLQKSEILKTFLDGFALDD